MAECERCDRPMRAKGLCATHYQAMRRLDPTAPDCTTCASCGGSVRRGGLKDDRPFLCLPCRGRELKCLVPECTHPMKTGGLCSRHYGGIKNRRRRARRANVKSERYDLADVVSRDGTICGLCNLEVDLSLKYPHVDSASVDHVIPISLGGDDTLANVQLAHFRCNSAKGGRLWKP